MFVCLVFFLKKNSNCIISPILFPLLPPSAVLFSINDGGLIPASLFSFTKTSLKYSTRTLQFLSRTSSYSLCTSQSFATCSSLSFTHHHSKSKDVLQQHDTLINKATQKKKTIKIKKIIITSFRKVMMGINLLNARCANIHLEDLYKSSS